MNKVLRSPDEAVADIADGSAVMVGGFGLCGIPENLIDALHRKGSSRLTIISNNAGTTEYGLVKLLMARQVERLLASYVGENKVLEDQVLRGEIKLELNPQGTLAERIRAGGAGIPAFYTPAGVGTVVAQGKEVREFHGRRYLLERGLVADFALIKAWKGDRLGNLIYRKTARNFNPLMATAAKVTIAEVEELVEPGALDPDAIITPGIFVHRLLVGSAYAKRIERRTLREAQNG